MPLHRHTRLLDRDTTRMRVDVVRHARLVDFDLLGLRAERGDPVERAVRIVHAAVFVPDLGREHERRGVHAMLTAAARVLGGTGDPVDALLEAVASEPTDGLVAAIALAAPWLPFDDRWTAAIGGGRSPADARLIAAVLAMDGDPRVRRAWLDDLVRRRPRLERDPCVGPLAEGLEAHNPLAAPLLKIERDVAARLGAILPATAEQLPLDLGRDAPTGSTRAARRALFGRESLPTLVVATRLARIASHPLLSLTLTAPDPGDHADD